MSQDSEASGEFTGCQGAVWLGLALSSFHLFLAVLGVQAALVGGPDETLGWYISIGFAGLLGGIGACIAGFAACLWRPPVPLSRWLAGARLVVLGGLIACSPGVILAIRCTVGIESRFDAAVAVLALHPVVYVLVGGVIWRRVETSRRSHSD